jgi:hypothetical protein
MLFRTVSVQNNLSVYYDVDSGSVVTDSAIIGISMVH